MTQATTETDRFGDEIATPVELVDRSTLELWTVCPQQAAAVERKLCLNASPAMDSGTEVHRCISEVTAMIASGFVTRLADAKAAFVELLEKSRPDVQPDALKSAWAGWDIFKSMLFHRDDNAKSPQDLICFDGGKDLLAGQKAWDITLSTSKVVRITCELDRLEATASPKCADLWDYKTGHSVWGIGDIQDSFQFGTFYPALVFLNYPELEQINVRIWNTRANQVTPPVPVMKAKFLDAAYQRIIVALELREAFATKKLHEIPTWPATGKCVNCPWVRSCPAALGDIRESADPTALVGQLIATEARYDSLKELVTDHIKAHGPIKDSNGDIIADLAPTANPKRSLKLS